MTRNRNNRRRPSLTERIDAMPAWQAARCRELIDVFGCNPSQTVRQIEKEIALSRTRGTRNAASNLNARLKAATRRRSR
jgi:hypothetical protein